MISRLLTTRDVAFHRLVKFSQILKNNQGLTPRVLSLRLKDLQNDGLIERVLGPKDQRVVNYRLRQANQKQKAVAAFKSLNYKVIAAGDSFNDTAMLAEADVGFLFHAPDLINQQFPQFKPYEKYSDLLEAIKRAMTS